MGAQETVNDDSKQLMILQSWFGQMARLFSQRTWSPQQFNPLEFDNFLSQFRTMIEEKIRNDLKLLKNLSDQLLYALDPIDFFNRIMPGRYMCQHIIPTSSNNPKDLNKMKLLMHKIQVIWS